MDESILDVKIPSMILQPIVENAVNYGIRNIDWEGHIELNVYCKDGFAYISIWDNGAGMTQEKIYQILHGELKQLLRAHPSAANEAKRNFLYAHA